MSDRAGVDNSERFPYRKDDKGNHLCRACGSVLDGRKTSFCDQRCLRDFFMLSDWRRVRRVVYARDGGICMKCGEHVPENEYHVDHVDPLSNGGEEWELSNLELSCPTCNLKKGAAVPTQEISIPSREGVQS